MMKYLVTILLFMTISFNGIFIYNYIKLEGEIKEKLKISSIFILLAMPMAVVIFSVLFIALLVISKILSIEISTYNIFLISIIGIFITFICEYLIKYLLSTIIGNLLNKKYSNVELSQNEITSIIKKKKGTIELLKYISMVVISFLVYFTVIRIININTSIIISILVALINGAIYGVMFRSSYE